MKLPFLILTSYCLALAVVHPSGQGTDFLVYRFGQWDNLAWVYPVWAKVLWLPYHLLPLPVAWALYLATLLGCIGYIVHYWQLSYWQCWAVPVLLMLYVGQCDVYLGLGLCLVHRGLSRQAWRWVALGLYLLSIKPLWGGVMAITLLYSIPCENSVKWKAYSAMLGVMLISLFWWHEWHEVIANLHTTYLKSNNLIWDSVGWLGLGLFAIVGYRGFRWEYRLLWAGLLCWLCLPYFSFSNLSVIVLLPTSGFLAVVSSGLVLKLVLPSTWVDYGLQGVGTMILTRKSLARE